MADDPVSTPPIDHRSEDIRHPWMHTYSKGVLPTLTYGFAAACVIQWFRGRVPNDFMLAQASMLIGLYAAKRSGEKAMASLLQGLGK